MNSGLSASEAALNATAASLTGTKSFDAGVAYYKEQLALGNLNRVKLQSMALDEDRYTLEQRAAMQAALNADAADKEAAATERKNKAKQKETSTTNTNTASKKRETESTIENTDAQDKNTESTINSAEAKEKKAEATAEATTFEEEEEIEIEVLEAEEIEYYTGEEAETVAKEENIATHESYLDVLRQEDAEHNARLAAINENIAATNEEAVAEEEAAAAAEMEAKAKADLIAEQKIAAAVTGTTSTKTMSGKSLSFLASDNLALDQAIADRQAYEKTVKNYEKAGGLESSFVSTNSTNNNAALISSENAEAGAVEGQVAAHESYLEVLREEDAEHTKRLAAIKNNTKTEEEEAAAAKADAKAQREINEAVTGRTATKTMSGNSLSFLASNNLSKEQAIADRKTYENVVNNYDTAGGLESSFARISTSAHAATESVDEFAVSVGDLFYSAKTDGEGIINLSNDAKALSISFDSELNPALEETLTLLFDEKDVLNGVGETVVDYSVGLSEAESAQMAFVSNEELMSAGAMEFGEALDKSQTYVEGYCLSVHDLEEIEMILVATGKSLNGSFAELATGLEGVTSLSLESMDAIANSFATNTALINGLVETTTNTIGGARVMLTQDALELIAQLGAMTAALQEYLTEEQLMELETNNSKFISGGMTIGEYKAAQQAILAQAYAKKMNTVETDNLIESENALAISEGAVAESTETGLAIRKNEIIVTGQQTAAQEKEIETLKREKDVKDASNASMKSWVAMGIMAGIMAISTFVNGLKKLIESLEDLGDELQDDADDLKSYKEKIEDAQNTLNSSTATLEEATQARQDLLDIQSEMIDSYGEYEGAINSITQAVDGETEAFGRLYESIYSAKLDEASKDTNWFTKFMLWAGGTNAENYSKAMVESMGGGYNDVQSILSASGSYANSSWFNWVSGIMTGGITPAGKAIVNAIVNKYAKDSGAALAEEEGYLTAISDLEEQQKELNRQLVNGEISQEDYADQIEDTTKQIDNLNNSSLAEVYNAKVLSDIYNNHEATEYYEALTDAYDEYAEALTSGDEDAELEAINKYKGILQNANGEVSSEVYQYFLNMYPELQAALDAMNFEIDVEANVNGVADNIQDDLDQFDSVSQFNAFEDEINSMYEKSDASSLMDYLENYAADDGFASNLVDAYKDLVLVAEDYGMEVDDLISKEAEMGNIDTITDAELDSAVKFKGNHQASEEIAYTDAQMDRFMQVYEAESQAGEKKDYEELAKILNFDTAGKTAEEVANYIEEVVRQIVDYETGDGDAPTHTIQYVDGGYSNTGEEGKYNEAFDAVTSGYTDQEKSVLYENSRLINRKAQEWIDDESIDTVEEYKSKIQALAYSLIAASKEQKTFVDSVEQVQSLQDGFDLIDDIYTDVKDGEDFDWSSLINNDDFNTMFEGLDNVEGYENAYSDFIETVSNSPKDIKKCQSAFNKLATAYVYNSGYLDNLTEDSKDVAVAMLKQMGVANALEVVEYKLDTTTRAQAHADALLSDSKYDLVNAKDEDKQATIANIQEYLVEQGVTDACRLSVFQLMAAQYLQANQDLDFSSKVSDLEDLAAAYLGTANSARICSEMEGIEAAVDHGGLSEEEAEEKINNLLNDYDPFNIEVPTVTYTGATTSDDSSSGSDTDNEPTEIDWIEKRIDRIQRKIDQLSDTAGSAWESWTKRTKALNAEMKKTSTLLSNQKKGAAYYKKYAEAYAKANSGIITKDIKSKVANGAIKISEYDSDTADVIQEYMDRYEKYLDMLDSIEETKDNLIQLYIDAFDDVGTKYDSLISLLDSENDLYTSKEKDATESLGDSMSASEAKEYYDYLNKREDERQKYLNKELTEQQKAEKDFLKNGGSKDSEEYRSMEEAINETRQAIQESINTQAENNLEIKKAHFQELTDAIDKLEHTIDDNDFIAELLEAQEDLFDEYGNFTDAGNTTLATHLADIAAYQEELQKAQSAYQEIIDDETNYRNGELIDDMQDLADDYEQQAQEAAKAIYDAQDDIVSLWKDMYDEMMDTLNDLMDTSKDQLQTQKDLYDYQKSIQEKSDTITDYQRQLNALSGDDSESARATRQQLLSQLNDAEDDLYETQWSQYISEVTDAYSDLTDDLQDWLDDRLDNTDQILSDTKDLVAANLEAILATANISLSDAGFDSSEALYKHILSGLSNYINTGSTTSLAGYAVGSKSIDRNQLAWTQEKGQELIFRKSDGAMLTPLGAGDAVFTAEQTAALWNLSKGYIPGFASGAAPQVNVPASTYNGGTVNNDMAIAISLPGVTNYDEFVSKLKSDGSFEKFVQQVTVGKALGKNSLLKNRY